MRRAAIALTITAAAVAVVVLTYRYSGGLQQERVVVTDPAKVLIVRTPGGLLEVATATREEEFGWLVRYRCPLIDCPSLLKNTVSKVRVPVHYVYRVPLSESWELVPKGDHYELTVPGLQASSPVAFDTSKLQIETNRGWFTPPTRGNEQALMRELGAELSRRAGQESYLKLAEPHAAKTVREFAAKWTSEQKVAADRPIQVRFRTAP